jgi:hypothetical protein
MLPAVIRIYRAGTAAEAHLLVDELREEGIETHVTNEASQGMLGDIASSQPEVWLLAEEQEPRARQVVRAFEAARQDDSDATVLCPACAEENPGNFELCWKCRKPLALFH